jgi:DNA-binding NarL/FixJ family response regulator
MTPAPMGSRVLPSLWPVEEPKARQVLVVDDHVTFAEVLARRLDAEPGINAFFVTGIEQARRVMLEGRAVDLLLLNIGVDESDVIRFAHEILSRNPQMRIVVVTASEDESQVVEAVRAGISGWVPKNEPFEYLLSVVRGALIGETWIPPRLLTRVVAELTSAQREGTEYDHLLAALTTREREVLDCLCSGIKKDDIAQHLYLSGNTVRTHIQNILGKLRVHSALAAVALAKRARMGNHDSRDPSL